MNDDYHCVSLLRIDLFDCRHKTPSAYMREVKPTNFTREAWIPNTMGDSVIVLYEFPNETDRLAWESSLPADVSRWLDRRNIAHWVTHFGFSIRDENGFLMEETKI